ncbi:hypothetical protein CpecA_0109 [Chlamydia pecorum IPTaLE]|uniref:Uncharacterized protein n=1 Tax=Chlamydia pecorum (strain ATCC VR-628 / DSM 29919 / E58) TaxID=331635 RepID=A0AA34RCE8_CHLPE|nr:hypothetical protein G5S_0120 [Chlamydia pecorum E58]ETF39008.1 hypothetical protein CpecF_0108 [Chlamydia pecorum DBDeUG]ETF40734.1 hypothetical protein CpecA_0109 [Chlamydia pecorum IPTaLE]
MGVHKTIDDKELGTHTLLSTDFLFKFYPIVLWIPQITVFLQSKQGKVKAF